MLCADFRPRFFAPGLPEGFADDRAQYRADDRTPRLPAMTKPGEDQTAGADPTAPRPFSFRWRRADGRVTVLNCLAHSAEEAEESARRAGWPGHDGTRAGRFRAWLKQAVLSDLPPAPLPAEPDAVVPPPRRGPALRLSGDAGAGQGKPAPPPGEEDR